MLFNMYQIIIDFGYVRKYNVVFEIHIIGRLAWCNIMEMILSRVGLLREPGGGGGAIAPCPRPPPLLDPPLLPNEVINLNPF